MSPLEESIARHKALIEADKQGLQQPLIDPIQLLTGLGAAGIRGALAKGMAPMAESALAPMEQSQAVQNYLKWKALMESRHGRMVYGK